MTAERLAILALVIVSVAAVLAFTLRRQSLRRRAAEKLYKENLEVQEFAIAQLDLVGRLLGISDISAAELKAQSDAIFTEMESRSIDGRLDALIDDTRRYVQEQIEKRETGQHG